jgi:hypothetical protein
MAKTKTSKPNKNDHQDQELFVIIDRETNKRIYVGPGVPRSEADRVATHFNDVIVVPAADVKNRYYQPTESNAQDGQEE